VDASRDRLIRRLDELDRRAHRLHMIRMLNESEYNLRANIRALRERMDEET
jgi:hypothetical protein